MPSETKTGSGHHAGDLFALRTRPRDLPELMDGCTDRTMLAGCLRDLAIANRLTGSYRPTLAFLDRLVDRQVSPRRPLRILDVGSGYGDMLRRIVGWARRRRIPVELTGMDLNPLSAVIAAEATAQAGLPADAVTWKTGDAMHATGPAPDVVLTSLVMHHLGDEEIVVMLRWMERSATLGWFINDLERQRTPARLWSLLARVMRWHPFLHHDGPVSFRRAFRVDDWRHLLREAGVPPAAVSIRHTFPARLCVARLY